MRLKTIQLIFIAVFCSVLLVVTLWALYFEYNRPWKQYQKDFNRLEYSVALKRYQEPLSESRKQIGAEDIHKELELRKKKLSIIRTRGAKIQQFWLKDFGETDRCITCHQGINKTGFSEEPQPFKTHSGGYLKHHPVEKYGCVVCHAGQGPALTVDAAHGEVKNWVKPLLRGHNAQSSCGKCHFMDQKLPLSAELPGAPLFLDGWRLFMENNCIGCHKLSGYKRPDRIGPALTAIGSKVNRNWLRSWLRNPKDYLPKIKMPRYSLTDEDVSYIASYLLSLKSPHTPLWKRGAGGDFKGGQGGVPGKAAKKEGEKLLNTLGCLGCHMINKKGGEFAPDLSDIGNKVNPDWLFQWLKDPKAYQPKTLMPDHRIPDREIQNITAYLVSLSSPSPGGRASSVSSPSLGGPAPKAKSFSGRGLGAGGNPFPEDIERGRRLVKDRGCTGCHEIEKFPLGYNAPELDGIGDKRVDELVFSNITDIDKTLINWLLIKIIDPERFATDKIITRMPTYDFNENQADALVTFLLGIRKDSVPPKYIKALIDPDKIKMKGKKVLEKYNCSGCHKINKEGGDIAPDLTKEGEKTRAEWLFTYLKNPYKIRPVLKAKMPYFNLSDKEINTIIEYLSFVSEESYPYVFGAKKEINIEDIYDGEKLYQEVLACIACHSVDEKGGQVGPDHTDTASRLKREWVEQWITNPQAIKPDTRMPRFKFKDWEFEALTNYLMTLGRYRFLQVKSED